MMLYKVRLPVPDSYPRQTRATHQGRVPLGRVRHGPWHLLARTFQWVQAGQFEMTIVLAALSCQPCWRPDLSQKGDR